MVIFPYLLSKQKMVDLVCGLLGQNVPSHVEQAHRSGIGCVIIQSQKERERLIVAAELRCRGIASSLIALVCFAML